MRKPFYRKQTGSWYVWDGGTQVRLSKDRDEAFRLWHSRMALNEPIRNDTSIQSVVERFLEWCRRHRSESTYDWYKLYLDNFVEHFGHSTVSQVKPSPVEDWLDREYGSCSNNGRNGVVRAVVRPFNWAMKRGLLDKNPLRGVERPQPESREVYIHPQQWERMMASVREQDPVRDILTILRETGCRPHEARTVEARFVDRSLRAWVFPVKNSKGKRHRRVVPLSDTAWAITQKLMLQRPEGPIFRNRRGLHWTSDALCDRMRTISRRSGVKCTPYAIRHTFITDALVNGVDPVTVATIVGHKGLDMIMKVYQHLQLRQDHIQAALKKAVGG